MKLRLFLLAAISALSLIFGLSFQPVMALSANETVQPILIQPGNGVNQPGGGTSAPSSIPNNNQTVKFKNVALWVNPEYDDQRLLVMLEGSLDGATAPVTVGFLVPSAASMYSAGSKDTTGKYTGGPPDRKASQIPGWDEISYVATQQIFRVEYYDSVIPSQPDKSFSYDFHSIAPISNMVAYVQQPKKSTNFRVTPQGTAGVDSEGFNIFTYNYNNVTADSAPIHYDISYTTGGSNTGFLIGLGAVILVIGGAMFWVLKPKRRYMPARSSEKRGYARQSKAQRDLPQGRQQGAKQGSRFCTKCGEPAGPTDKFCPSCGSKLRDST